MSILIMNIYIFSVSIFAIDAEMGVFTPNVLENIETFFKIFVDIVVVMGGILGFNYINKLREKQIDSIFSYLTRLNIRLKYFYKSLIDFKDEVMDRFVPESERREISADRVSIVKEAINNLSENANETLGFLMSEDNQIPAKQGWTNCFNTFIEFLMDCGHINNAAYFKWIVGDDLDKMKQEYYYKNLKNIEKLIKMVYERQSELEEDIFKKSYNKKGRQKKM